MQKCNSINSQNSQRKKTQQIASNAMYNNERRMYQNRGENLSNKYHCHISFHLHIPVTPDKIQIYRSSSTSLSATGFN